MSMVRSGGVTNHEGATEGQESNARPGIWVFVGWALPTGLSIERGGQCPPYEDLAACITFLTLSKDTRIKEPRISMDKTQD